LAIGFLRLLRAFKIIRALRVVRVFRLFTELRLLVASILTSLSSLLWSLVFLMVITYLCSIVFIQGGILYVTEHSSRSDPVYLALDRYFNTIPQAVYFLTASITGGVDWTEVAYPLFMLGNLYGIGFMAFVLISILGILNVVTGLFVERASNIPRIDRDFAILDQIRNMEADIHETMLLFNELDANNTGLVTLQEFQNSLADERVIAYFATLQIDVTDRNRVGMLFDIDDDNNISLEEFVVGCVKLRGYAKKTDNASIMVEMGRLHDTILLLDNTILKLSHGVKKQAGDLNSLLYESEDAQGMSPSYSPSQDPVPTLTEVTC